MRKLFSTVSVGRAANNVIPARGGDLLRIESMREVARVPAFVSAGTLFAERLLDGVVFDLDPPRRGDDRAGGIPLLTGIALSSGTRLGVALVIVAASPAMEPSDSSGALPAASLRAGTPASRGRPRTSSRGSGLPRPAEALFIFGTSGIMWLADVAMFAIVGHAFDLDLELGAYFVLEGIRNLALAVPATAAGIGSFDYLTLLAART